MKNPSAFGAYLGDLLGKWAPAAAALGFLNCIQPAVAASSGAKICMESADKVALVHQIPSPALRSLAVEQSGKLQDGAVLPWPWTVEFAGIRRWFSDRQAASDFVDQLQGQGHGPVKVGCFLVELPRHGAASGAEESLIEPGNNADLAARQLTRAFALTGTWDGAIRSFGAAYESPTPVDDKSDDMEQAAAGPPSSAALSGQAFARTGAGSLVSFGTNGTALHVWQEAE